MWAQDAPLQHLQGGGRWRVDGAGVSGVDLSVQVASVLTLCGVSAAAAAEEQYTSHLFTVRQQHSRELMQDEDTLCFSFRAAA